MNRKKLFMFLAIAAILVVLFVVYNRRKRDQISALESEVQQTNANGLFGYLTNIFNQTTGGSSGSSMSEGEALEYSKRIADLKETGAESAEIEANSLIQELAVNGWQYIGWNQVKAINP